MAGNDPEIRGQHNNESNWLVPLITHVYPKQQQPASRVFPAKQILALSVALMVFGGCSMLFNAVGLADGYSLLVASPGFYCGGFFVVTGGIGIRTVERKSQRFIIALMMMSISAATAFAVVQFSVALAALVKDASGCEWYWNFDPDCYVRWPLPVLAIVMDGLLVVCAIVAASLSIRLSVLCCRLTCRCCARGDCDCTCCEVQDSAVPIAIYYRNTPHQPVSLPNTYVDAGRVADAQRQVDNNIRQLSQLPPAHLQYLLAISQSTPWPWPPVSQSHPHQQPPSYASEPVAQTPFQDQGQ